MHKNAYTSVQMSFESLVLIVKLILHVSQFPVVN